MFIFISGLSAIIMAFLGCCTSKVPDRCCVTTFCFFSMATFFMFSILTVVMITLNLKNQDFVDNYCQKESFTNSSSAETDNQFNNLINDIASKSENLVFSATKTTFSEIDDVMISGIQEYMCKAKCPCDPRGINSFNKWSLSQQKEFSNKDVYFFNGRYLSYFECY